jgi:hypothetical protein
MQVSMATTTYKIAFRNCCLFAAININYSNYRAIKSLFVGLAVPNAATEFAGKINSKMNLQEFRGLKRQHPAISEPPTRRKNPNLVQRLTGCPQTANESTIVEQATFTFVDYAVDDPYRASTRIDTVMGSVASSTTARIEFTYNIVERGIRPTVLNRKIEKAYGH